MQPGSKDKSIEYEYVRAQCRQRVGRTYEYNKASKSGTTAPLLFSVIGVSLDLFLLVTGGLSPLATKIELGLGSRWPFYSDSI